MKLTPCLLAIGLTLTPAALAEQPAAQSLYTPYPDAVMPALSSRGPFQAGVRTLEIVAPQQPADLAGNTADRPLTVEVWYPAEQGGDTTIYANETRSGIPFKFQGDAVREAPVADHDGKFPVVVLSHGYTGYRTIMYYLGEHLASHGYIVAGIDHTDSTNADVDMEKAPYAGFPSTLLNRARDQQFTLTAITEHPGFAEYADPGAAGLIGYSMGGYGAVNTVGGCFDFSDAAVTRLTGLNETAQIEAVKKQLNTCGGGHADSSSVDPRWQAMVALAPWGGQFPVFSQSAMAAIDVPSLYIAGEYDDISGYVGIRWMYESMQTAPAYLLTVHNARHNIAPHPAPREAMGSELDVGHYLEPAWRTQSLNAINEHFTLAMMDCYVKKMPAACDFLNVEGSSAQTPQKGDTPPPWKGFDHRYALGLSMETRNLPSPK